jgi:hypothetical protein
MKNLVVIEGACLSAALLTGCGGEFSASTPASGALCRQRPAKAREAPVRVD